MRIVGRIKSQINKLMPRASFARNVGILAGGTALAQALSVLALPVITRLYTPEDFSVLAVYAALLGMIGVVACLRFEIAIPLPSDDFEAANLMVLGLIFTTVTSALVFLSVALVPEQIANGLGQPALQTYLWLLPVGVWLTGAFGCVQYWATRCKHFSAIAQTRMTQSVGSVLVQMLLGWLMKTGPLGLLLGQVTGSCAGLIQLVKLAWSDLYAHKKRINRDSLQNCFRKYSNYPKFSTFESLANTANNQLPILIIAATTSGPEVGFALLAIRTASIPMGLLGNSIAQVYVSRAADEYREDRLSEFTKKIIIKLILIGVIPLFCVGVLAPKLVPYVFGNEWSRSGEVIAWMIPWFTFQFLASPVSMSLHITSNHKIALYLQLYGLFLRVGFAVIASVFCRQYALEVYSITGAIFYLTYLLCCIRISGINFKMKK